jgi:predicted phosphate transport protein (TIGR00153 family)
MVSPAYALLLESVLHRHTEVPMFSLFPREEDFFALFRKQSAFVRQAGGLLLDMLTKYDRIEERARQLKTVEHEADQVTHELMARLNKTFITPLEREDIHDLASNLDDVVDAIEALANRFLLFRITAATPEALKLATILSAATGQIDQAVTHLKNSEELNPFLVEINRLENEADEVSRQVVADLFSGRHEVLDVLRWREIYGRLENAADKCEDVANTIEAIILKSR